MKAFRLLKTEGTTISGTGVELSREKERPVELFSHFLKDWYDLVKCWSFAWVFIHTDPDQFSHVGGNTGADVQPHPLRGDLHPGLHGSEVAEGDLPG